MFSIHDFIMSTIMGMIHNYPDWQVREYSLNWYSKGKITQQDLMVIEAAITEPVIKYTEAPQQRDDNGYDVQE